MKKRVADIIFEELAKYGLKHVFMLSGGGIMYLVDALGRSQIMPVCCHHEQAAAIAAQAYAMQKNGLSCCLSTTGPGGTNALTGCAAAFMDSTPLLFISGQVKTADFASKRNVRQYGAQENDILSMARPVTKFAALLENPEDCLYLLQKAIYHALEGRQGPVWLDIPLDIQSAFVETGSLRQFKPETDFDKINITGDGNRLLTAQDGIKAALERLSNSRRPLLLAGHGVAGMERDIRAIARKTGIPVVCSWRALDILGADDPLFYGSPGLQAPRYSNIITQAADFLLILGSRLDNMMTAFNEERFGRRAQKVAVDIDAAELNKLAMPDLIRVNCDLRGFLPLLRENLESGALQAADFQSWRGFCAEMKKRFPLELEKQDQPGKGVDLYRLARQIGLQMRPDDALVISSTSRCNTAGHIALPRHEGQRSVSSMGLGAMGFALPSITGAWFASGGRRVIALEGDGSLQLNIQELQTIKHYNIDARVFVFNNNGYAAIAAMQDRNFGGFHVGCDAGSGVSMPDLREIASAYGFTYLRIEDDGGIEEGVRQALTTGGPLICEAFGDINFDEIPKCISRLDSDGRRVSADLENPYPFLAPEVINDIFAPFDASNQSDRQE